MRSDGQGRVRSAPSRLWRVVLAAARDLIAVTVEGQAAGLTTVRTLWRQGPVSWLGLALLGVGIVATTYLRLHRGELTVLQTDLWEGESVAAPAAALILSLLLFAVGWAYLLAGAARAGLSAYVLAAAYAIYYCLPIGFGLRGTPWLVLIPLWLLALGGWVASSQRSRWRLPLLLLLSLLVAMLLYPALGLKAILSLTLGRLVLGGLCFALVANPWALRARAYRPGLAFGVSLAVLGAFFAASLLHSTPTGVFHQAFISVHYLLGPVGLFWCWMGLDLVGSAQALAAWVAKTLKALVPRRALGLVIVVVWLLWGALAYMLVHRPIPPLALIQFLVHYDWGRRLLQSYALSYRSTWPSEAFIWAADYHLYVLLAIGLLTLGFQAARRLSLDRLMGLLGLSLLVFLALWSYSGLFYAFSESAPKAALGFWPLLAFVGGMSWQVLKESSNLVRGGESRPVLFLGFLLLFGGISLLEIAAGYRLFEEELSLNTFLGAAYLGLPYMLYDIYRRARRQEASLAGGTILLLFALGMASAIPSLILGRIAFVPLLWLAAYLLALWRRGGDTGRWDGLASAVALALGFVISYTHPILIPIPVFTDWAGCFLEVQARYGANIIWPWQARWWWILLAAVAGAIILGVLAGLARPRAGRVRALFLILAASLSTAWLAVCDLVLGVR